MQVIVEVGADCPGEAHHGHIDGGPAIPNATARRLACDASIVLMHEDPSGNVLDVGRKTRSMPPAIARALRRRDGGCRFPGCTAERFVDGHHGKHWADGGRTSLDNLFLLCRHHHRLVHEDGFAIVPDGTGAWRFARPDGSNVPRFFAPRPVAPGDLVAAQESLALSPLSLRPRWRGERLDDNMALGALQTLARRAR